MRQTIKSFISSKFTVWAAVFVLNAAFFAILRLLFLIYFHSIAANSRVVDILHAFWIGFRFDAKIISIILLPLVVVSLIPGVSFEKKAVRRIYVIVLSVIFGFLFMLSLAELRFFEAYGSRLNFLAVEYLSDAKMMFYTLYTDIGFWFTLLGAAIFIAIYVFALKYIIRKIISLKFKAAIIPEIVSYLLLIALLIFGIRGKLGQKALDWGAAFFSADSFANQLALNGCFTLANSIYEEHRAGHDVSEPESGKYHYYDTAAACRTVSHMLDLDDICSAKGLELSPTQSGPRWDFNPNIVIIIMESWSAKYIGTYGADYGVTPRFDSLAQHGILFKNFYANGIRSNRGIPAVLCSYPALPGRSIMKRFSAGRPFTSIAEILNRRDYTSIFAHGGDIQFDNIEGFLRAHGYRKFYSQSDFPGKALNKWGVDDHDVFEALAEKVDSFPRPFNLTVFTLSFHEPYRVPDDRFVKFAPSNEHDRLLNTFYYTDWSLGKLFDFLKDDPVMDSTIFIITADHCAHQTPKYPLTPTTFHIPLLLYSPALFGDSSQIVEKTASQVDIVPIIAGLLGEKIDTQRWGRDIFNLPDSDNGFAIIDADEKFGMVEDSMLYFHWAGAGEYLYDLGDQPYLQHNLKDSLTNIYESMAIRTNSYIQLAIQLSRSKTIK